MVTSCPFGCCPSSLPAPRSGSDHPSGARPRAGLQRGRGPPTPGSRGGRPGVARRYPRPCHGGRARPAAPVTAPGPGPIAPIAPTPSVWLGTRRNPRQGGGGGRTWPGGTITTPTKGTAGLERRYPSHCHGRDSAGTSAEASGKTIPTRPRRRKRATKPRGVKQVRARTNTDTGPHPQKVVRR